MKIYLSRSTTRSMMADYPIGDPTGGPAYGEKRDPFSAAISLFAMYTSGTAIATAGMSLMAGLTFAGAAINLIGNITGNKTLSSIGMIAGLAGGIGGFAESAGLFGEGNTLVGALTKGSEVDISSVFAPASGSLAPVVDGMQAPGSAGYMNAEAATVPGALNAPRVGVNAAPALQAPAAGVPAPAGAPASNLAITPGSGAAPVTLASNTAAAIPTAPGADLGVNPLTGKANPLMSYAPGFGPNAAAKDLTNPSVLDELKAGNFGAAASRVGSGAMDMLKTNPTGAYVVSKGIGAAVDYLSGKTDAELDQLKASTGYANAKALEIQTVLDREKARRANINASYGNVDAGIKVRPPGLVASAMQST